MKRKIIVAAITIILIALLLICFCNYYHLDTYMSKWETKHEHEISHIRLPDNLYAPMFTLDINQIVGENPLEIYCVLEDRVYFSYAESKADSFLWHIASIQRDGTDLTVHVSDEFFLAEEAPHYDTYKKLSYISNRAGEYGGLYYNNCIYLHGSRKTVKFDPVSKTTEYVDALPSMLSWEIKNGDNLIIAGENGSRICELTWAQLVQQNGLFQDLSEISKFKRWDDQPAFCEGFSDARIKVYNNNIYLILGIFHWSGQPNVLVLQFNSSTETFDLIATWEIDGPFQDLYDFIMSEP